MGSRHSLIRHKEIEYTYRLIFDDKGNIRLSRAACSLKANERMIKMTTTLPRALFTTPELVGTITVAEPSPENLKFDTRVAADAVRQAVGADIVFTVKKED